MASASPLQNSHPTPPPPPPETWRQQLYRIFVLLVYIYPIYIIRRLATWYTEREYQTRQKARCNAILSSTEEYATWKAVATTLDGFEGYEQWRTQVCADTTEYNEPKLRESAELAECLTATNCDAAMGTYLRTSLGRGMYGLGCRTLHKYYVGSKKTVEDYLSAVERMIDKFSSSSSSSGNCAGLNDSGADSETDSAHSSAPTTAAPSSSSGQQQQQQQEQQAESPRNNNKEKDEYDERQELHRTLIAGRDQADSDHVAPPQHIDLLHWATRDAAGTELELRNAQNRAKQLEQQQHEQQQQQQQQAPSSPAVAITTTTLSAKEKFLVLKNAAQAYGRTALMLSGGASLGMYHAGVVRALWSAKLLPKIISGSSAGAILGAIFCTRTDDEIEDLLGSGSAEGLEEKVNLDAFDSYDDPLSAISTRVWRLIRTGAFMDVEVLMRMMRSNCGDATFAEAYRRTGRICNIAIASVSREGNKNAKALTLNYVTAPNVMIWTAVAASCAYPRLFTAVQLLQKHPVTGSVHPFLPGQKWNDGSITADLPFDCLAELFNANFFIVSQVNPHVAPFVRPSLSHIVHKRSGWLEQCVQSTWFSACEEFRYWVLKGFRSGLIETKGENELLFLQLSQKYSGDVTIRPIRSFWSAFPDYVNLTSNPTKQLLEYVTGTAQRRTWPHIGMLEANMRVELALQEGLGRLQSQLAEEAAAGLLLVEEGQ